MRLLVTRPVDEAARTAEKLASLGHEPLLAPVMEVAPTGAALPSGSFDLVIATSARAFMGGAALPAPLACVGEKTAAAGRKAGFTVASVAPDAERLARLLLQQSGPLRVLYLAGRERRADLETLLRAEGWSVELVEVYATRPVAAWPDEIHAGLSSGSIDGALHYSPRSAELALGLIGAGRGRLAHFCLSPAVAAVCAREVGAERIFVASQPTEDCLMSVIAGRNASSGGKT